MEMPQKPSDLFHSLITDPLLTLITDANILTIILNEKLKLILLQNRQLWQLESESGMSHLTTLEPKLIIPRGWFSWPFYLRYTEGQNQALFCVMHFWLKFLRVNFPPKVWLYRLSIRSHSRHPWFQYEFANMLASVKLMLHGLRFTIF